MRRQVLILLLAMLPSLTGCFRYREELTLQADGSGSLALHGLLGPAVLDSLEVLRLDQPPSLDASVDSSQTRLPSLDRSAIEGRLRRLGSSLRLIRYSASAQDSGAVWDVSFAFERPAQLDDLDLALSGGEGGPLGGARLAASVTWEEQPDGSWVYRRVMEIGRGPRVLGAPRPQPSAPMLGGEEREGGDRLWGPRRAVPDDRPPSFARGLDGPVAVLIVHFPGVVVDSNASTVTDSTATWSYDRSDLWRASVAILRARVKP